MWREKITNQRYVRNQRLWSSGRVVVVVWLWLWSSGRVVVVKWLWLWSTETQCHYEHQFSPHVSDNMKEHPDCYVTFVANQE